ncbi:MAG: exodeoxyribonuclease VII large subunit [Phycisphaerales bacterium]|nr:exodeoxyribonuclease VII large subunit [Planctomycetota bacterium]
MAAPRRQTEPAGDAPWTVSRLAERIDGALKAGVPGPVRVVGEVSGFRDRTHWYFDLKDENAVVNCVMFASAARRVGPAPRDGDLIVVKGRLEFYAKGGKVSFLVETIERAGEGPLDRAFRELCNTLRAEGYFAPERKKALPRYPRRIAVLTSRSGAALQDVINTRTRRWPAVGLVVIDVPVQGPDAAPAIASAIGLLSAQAGRLGIDAAILTRGGGSKEDLWCFNERVVADAIFRSRVPLVAAIGHETDTTIAELVADERCATPTQAAMRLIPDRAELLRQVDSTRRRVATALARCAQASERDLSVAFHRLEGAGSDRLALAQRRLAALELRLERVRPRAVHARMIARLEHAAKRLSGVMAGRLRVDIAAVADRLQGAMAGRLREKRARTEALAKHLRAVSPEEVLERGFSITSKAGGGLVRSIRDVPPGQKLVTRLADGSVESVASGNVAKAPRRKAAPAGPGLFGSEGE